MRTKTTMRYHLTLLSIAITKRQEITSAGKDMEKRESLGSIGGNVNWYSHYGKKYGCSSKKLKIKLPYETAIPPLGVYLKNTKITI